MKASSAPHEGRTETKNSEGRIVIVRRGGGRARRSEGTLALALLLISAACARPPSGGDRLLAAAEAIQRMESVVYDYAYEGSGSAAGSFTGRVLLARSPDGPMLYRADLRPSPSWDPASAADLEGTSGPAAATDTSPPALILSGGGDHVAARDEARGRFSHGTISGGSGHLVANAPYAVLSAFTEARPFAAELASDFDVVSQETVGGVLCDVVRGTTDEFGPARVWWHIGVEDDLPRAFRWEAEDGSGALSFEMRGLEVDRVISAEQLAIRVNVADSGGDEVVAEDERLLTPGVTAPDWHLPAAAGGALRLSELRGEIVVLGFWSTWCVPCRDLATRFGDLARQFSGSGVRFLALNGWEGGATDPDATLRAWGVEVPVLLHAERIAADYRLIAPPALFVVDARGDLALVRNPALEDPAAEAAEVERTVRSLLDGGG